MESIFLYLLNRKPSNEERKEYQTFSQKYINKIIIRTKEYHDFVEQEKNKIILLITKSYSISLEEISTKSRDVISQKLLDIKRKSNYSNEKIINLLDEIKKNLQVKIESILGIFTDKILREYLFIGEIYFKYLENDLVLNLKKLDNLEKCYRKLIWDEKFTNFVENSIHKSI